MAKDAQPGVPKAQDISLYDLTENMNRPGPRFVQLLASFEGHDFSLWAVMFETQCVGPTMYSQERRLLHEATVSGSRVAQITGDGTGKLQLQTNI